MFRDSVTYAKKKEKKSKKKIQNWNFWWWDWNIPEEKGQYMYHCWSNLLLLPYEGVDHNDQWPLFLTWFNFNPSMDM